jgi:flagellar basal-body rod modification protein FlgD
VRTLAAGERKAGALEVEWDGRDDTGQRLAPGSYRVIAAAKGADGAAVPVDLLGKGRVTGVSFDGADPTLLVGGARVALPDVYELHQA